MGNSYILPIFKRFPWWKPRKARGGGLSPPRKKLKQKPKKSYGVEPLNWQSFIEIGEMAWSTTAWCSRGHTLNKPFRYIIFLFFDCKCRLHLLLFSLIVPLCGVRPWCVGLARKISARCNTGSYVFSFLFICIFILLLALSHIYVFLFPQRVPSDLEVGHEKSILTRTEILFYHYLFRRTPVICDFISQENAFLFAIYFH